MKDNMKPCQHSLSDDIVYKEVVIIDMPKNIYVSSAIQRGITVQGLITKCGEKLSFIGYRGGKNKNLNKAIGNGPSGMVTSFMLAGNVPYLKEIPQDLPIDDMLRARLSNLPPGQSLYEADLVELAEGLEGRSQNPIPLLLDNLLRPCADLGIQSESLIEWGFDIEKQIDHIVLGRGPPGGAWHTFPPSVRTLSPGAWLALPPHDAAGAGRLSARAVAKYCRRYVHACRLQRYFRNGVIVTRVSVFPPSGAPCRPSCPLNAAFCVYGYDKSEGRPFRYACRRVVLACGAGDRPNTLEPHVAKHALHSLASIERAVQVLSCHESSSGPPPALLVVGSGASAADAVCLGRRARLRTHHAYRARRSALAALEPRAYPDYSQLYKMMCDGKSGNYPNYYPHPEHIIMDVQPLDTHADDALTLKRVTLLDVVTNETKDIVVSLIAVLIGSKPDLFFLQTNFNLDCIEVKCIKCSDETKHAAKRKIEDNQRQCFLRNHWHYLKSVVGQSIQSCKSRYLNYTEINGNSDNKCVVPNCNQEEKKCECLATIENGKDDFKDCKCEIIPYSELENKFKCTCQQNPYSGGIGFGIDPNKPVDGRGNPIAIDKRTHELLSAPKGIYALGPITADNFVRFIPGGALAIVSNIHRENKNE